LTKTRRFIQILLWVLAVASLALTLFRPELDIWSPGEHNGTFRGNQIAFVAAKAAIEVMNNEHLTDNVRKNESLLRDRLTDIASVDERLAVRGIGYIWGVDCGRIPVKGFARRVICKCFENGLIVELAGREDCVVKLMPPLIADEDILTRGLAILETSLKECLAEL